MGEPMAAHTTFRVGGPADIALLPDTPARLMEAVRIASEYEVPYVVIGNGSNLVVRDGGIRGIAILTSGMNAIEVQGCTLRAQAGALLPQLSAEALRAGLSGLEFASGIPGSVGGATAMNAGAYGEEISHVLRRALVLMDGAARWFSADELEMGYRSTRVLKSGGIVLEAEFALAPGSSAAIRAKMDELNQRRRDKQPLNFPSAGSTFKRPEGHFAGALIERAGLKGLRVGGAQVSEKHAGFVVNALGARASDILALIELVQQRVLAHSGVTLECEVRILGED